MRAAARLALLAGAALAPLAACGGTASAPDASSTTHRLTPDEVTRRFTEWACPGRPELATPLTRLTPLAVDPESQPLSQGGRWIVFTSAGSVGYRESTGAFEPSEPAAASVRALQDSAECRTAR
ncbi:MAG: hypothetical protein EPO16_10050 [Dehalococcoidia bacterium]|nr:MAG: hypothetical protein EPO16_10050 [Dehalococcoidia bacterium]